MLYPLVIWASILAVGLCNFQQSLSKDFQDLTPFKMINTPGGTLEECELQCLAETAVTCMSVSFYDLVSQQYCGLRSHVGVNLVDMQISHYSSRTAVALGSACSADADCAALNSGCLGGVCQCSLGYIEDDNMCVTGCSGSLCPDSNLFCFPIVLNTIGPYMCSCQNAFSEASDLCQQVWKRQLNTTYNWQTAGTAMVYSAVDEPFCLKECERMGSVSCAFVIMDTNRECHLVDDSRLGDLISSPSGSSAYFPLSGGGLPPRLPPAAPPPGPATPDISVQGKLFRVFTVHKNWFQAVRFCSCLEGGGNGWKLAEPEHKKQIQALRTFIMDQGYGRSERFWLGGNEGSNPTVARNKWRWASTDRKIARRVLPRFWAVDTVDPPTWSEPNNSGGQESCMNMLGKRGRAWYLNDSECKHEWSFFCERPE